VRRFVRLMDATAVTCAVAASAMLLAAVLIVTWMVAYRAAGHSTYWELESAVYLMVAAVFLGSPYCLKTRGHVAVDLLGHYLPPRFTRSVDVAVAVIGLAVCAYLAYAGGQLAWSAFHEGERTGSLWNPPRWPLFLTMPVGLGLTALQYVAELLRKPEHGS
jgi:TRAP-type C4-dicarboxylate transport system permease small subunit